jgi:undecaprenyl-diphosphatase
MPLFQIVLLAVVQGITEFLPISSSAHLALAPWLFHWHDQGLTFDIALHFGTLAAVLVYFFRDWVQLTAQAAGLDWGRDAELKKSPRMFWMLAAASLPIGVLGYAFKGLTEETLRENHILIGSMLIGVGLLMAVAERVGRGVKDVGSISFLDSMIIGCAQVLALVPGTSRSGITITAGLFLNVNRAAAARFSFLLSTPAIAAAAFKAFWDLRKSGAQIEIAPFLIGMAVSAVTGGLMIAFLLSYLRRHSLKFFIYYRVVFGIIVIALAVFVRP